MQKSMEPTIRSGDIVLLDEDAYDAAGPALGDIVSARAPAGADSDRCGEPLGLDAPCRLPTRELSEGLSVVKRVVALGGQRVAIDASGGAVVDGESRFEPYLTRCGRGDGCRLLRPVTVPKGYVFLLGDNRPYSSDSRQWGAVPLASLEGRISLSDAAR